MSAALTLPEQLRVELISLEKACAAGNMSINLLYHDVTAAGQENASGFSGPGAARYKLKPDEFQRHLERIAATIRQPPSVTTEPTELVNANTHAWTISFDDGGLSSITDIAGRLESFGWRGWFFIATDFIGQPSFCSHEQLRELHRRGHVIGSHSCSHPERFSSCSWEHLVDEWSRSCRILSEIIHHPVTTASVPGGFYSKNVARAAGESGIKVLFNSEPTTTSTLIGDTLILGRFNIYRGMSAYDASSLVSNPLRRVRQAAFWNAKKVAKVLAGPLYKLLREQILGRAYADAESPPKIK